MPCEIWVLICSFVIEKNYTLANFCIARTNTLFYYFLDNLVFAGRKFKVWYMVAIVIYAYRGTSTYKKVNTYCVNPMIGASVE